MPPSVIPEEMTIPMEVSVDENGVAVITRAPGPNYAVPTATASRSRTRSASVSVSVARSTSGSEYGSGSSSESPEMPSSPAPAPALVQTDKGAPTTPTSKPRSMTTQSRWALDTGAFERTESGGSSSGGSSSSGHGSDTDSHSGSGSHAEHDRSTPTPRTSDSPPSPSPSPTPVISFSHLPSQSPRTALILNRFSLSSPILYISNDLLLSTTQVLGRPFFDFVRPRDEGRVREWVGLVKGWGVNESGQPSDGGFGFGRFGLVVGGRESRLVVCGLFSWGCVLINLVYAARGCQTRLLPPATRCTTVIDKVPNPVAPTTHRTRVQAARITEARVHRVSLLPPCQHPPQALLGVRRRPRRQKHPR